MNIIIEIKQNNNVFKPTSNNKTTVKKPLVSQPPFLRQLQFLNVSFSETKKKGLEIKKIAQLFSLVSGENSEKSQFNFLHFSTGLVLTVPVIRKTLSPVRSGGAREKLV